LQFSLDEQRRRKGGEPFNARGVEADTLRQIGGGGHEAFAVRRKITGFSPRSRLGVACLRRPVCHSPRIRRGGLGDCSLDDSPGPMHRPTQSEMAARGVLDLAREVRIHLHDARVIFGTIVSVVNRDARHFLIRPWGLRVPMTIGYDAVSHAVPVKLMVWKKQRDISAAQRTGDFSGATLRPAPTGPLQTVGPLALETSAPAIANDNQTAAEESIPQIPAEEPIPQEP
jgi:hypothetical protein